LPGGGKDNTGIDPDLRATAIREAREEVKVRCIIKAAIGEPLYLPIKKDGVLVRVDCAQAFLVETSDTPTVSEEALAVAFVHQQSFAGFNVVSRKVDPTSPFPGRTPVMIWDGLSILQPPFREELLTDELRAILIGNPDDGDYVLVDDGSYLGRAMLHSKSGAHDDLRWYFELYYRLNPDQPDGRFHGAFG
jgi:hypothetical protein